jgi:hypothetical protein
VTSEIPSDPNPCLTDHPAKNTCFLSCQDEGGLHWEDCASHEAKKKKKAKNYLKNKLKPKRTGAWLKR